MTIKQVYEQTIEPLSVADRRQLATLILNDIPPQAVVDYREEWSAEDLDDFRRTTWEHIETLLEAEEHA